jgi:hypothetical protein
MVSACTCCSDAYAALEQILALPFTSRWTRAPQPAHRKRRARRGRLDVPTLTTRSGGICFVDPLHADPQSRRLLAEVAGELPMRPLADLLVRLLAQADPRLVSRTSPPHAAHPSRWQ